MRSKTDSCLFRELLGGAKQQGFSDNKSPLSSHAENKVSMDVFLTLQRIALIDAFKVRIFYPKKSGTVEVKLSSLVYRDESFLFYLKGRGTYYGFKWVTDYSRMSY